MPFTAEAQNGNGVWRFVDITKFATPKLDLKGHELRCTDPDCHAPVIIKHGLVLTPHFAHKANAGSPDCIFSGAPESEDHRLAKAQIMYKLGSLPRYQGADIRPEQTIRIEDRKRLADVLVTWTDGAREVHEIQLSRTTIEECEERTYDYQAAGIDSIIWWFGGANRYDASLHQWAKQESGAVGLLDFEDQTQRL